MRNDRRFTPAMAQDAIVARDYGPGENPASHAHQVVKSAGWQEKKTGDRHVVTYEHQDKPGQSIDINRNPTKGGPASKTELGKKEGHVWVHHGGQSTTLNSGKRNRKVGVGGAELDAHLSKLS